MGAKEYVGIVVVGTSIILLVMGYDIGMRKSLYRVPWIDWARVRNPDMLARAMGSGAFVLGLFNLVVGMLMFALSVQLRWFIGALVIINVVGWLVLPLLARPYLSQPKTNKSD